MKGTSRLQKILYLIILALGFYILYKAGRILLESQAVQHALDSGELQRNLEDAAMRSYASGYTATVEGRDMPDWLAGWMRQVVPVYSYLAERQTGETDQTAREEARAGEQTEETGQTAREEARAGEENENPNRVVHEETRAGQQTTREDARMEDQNAIHTEKSSAGTPGGETEKAGGASSETEKAGSAGGETEKAGGISGEMGETSGAGGEMGETRGAGGEKGETGGDSGEMGEAGGEWTEEKPEENSGEAQEDAGEELQQAASRTVVSEELLAQLEDFDYLLANYFTVDEGTMADAQLLDADVLLQKDLRLAQDSSVPQILIYHTHSQEAFADSEEGKTEDSIVGMGEVLAEELRNTYGYNVIHDTGVYDLVDGVIDRSAAYDYAREAVEQILQEYPTIEVIIDLHRDGVDGEKFVTEIDGKPVSRIMFFNGISRDSADQPLSWLQNPYTQDNLAFSLQLQLAAEARYPGFTRNIYLKAERFNLHLRPRSLLIEAGTQLNTVAEERGAMTPLAALLHQVLGGEAEYSQ